MYLFCSVSLSIHLITVRNNLYVVLTWNVEGHAWACVINLYLVLHCAYSRYGGLLLCPVPHLTVHCIYSWYGRPSLCPVFIPGAAFTYIWYGGLSLCPCTYIWYCVHTHLIWQTTTVSMYLHLVLCLHTSDMADYHCTHVLTSDIVFTHIWYGGLSLCPCTYIWYCVHTHLIWQTITVPMYLHLLLCLHTSDMADYHCARLRTSGVVFTYIWFGGLSLCPCTYIWYCVHTHLKWRTITVSMYLHLILCSHTSDMADYHCAHVLTSDIVFTHIWYGGLSLYPCTYIWYCVHTHLIWRTITVPMYLHLVLCLHTSDLADYHCAHVLTSGIALYMHLTTSYATSRAVLHPAITIGTV